MIQISKKTKNILLFGVPLAIGTYLIYSQLKGKSNNIDAPPPPTPPSPPSPPSSSFPLKKGSKNALVGTVQALLKSAGENISVDNDFGSKTEAALLKVFGKKTIDNQADLDALRAKLAMASQTSANLDWAWKLIDSAANPANTKLMVKKEVNLQGVNKNFLNQWVSNNKSIKIPPRNNYTLNDYKLRSALTSGQLRIEIVTGALAGMYITRVETDLKATFDIVA